MPTDTTEPLEWLRNFITEINNQDNRITASPYYFTLRCPKKETGIDDDYAEGYAWYDANNSWEVTNLVNTLWEYWEEDEEGDLQAVLKDNDCDVEIKTSADIDDNVVEILAEHFGWRKVNYRITYEYKHFFFTEKACLQHLAQNKHHYPEGTDTYVDCAWRNPEIMALLENIGKLVGVEYLKR